MKKIQLCICYAILLAPTAFAEFPDFAVLPEMPQVEAEQGLPEGMSWRYFDGPDFYTYTSSASDIKIGIYFGRHPDFKKIENGEKTFVLPFSEYEAKWVSRKFDDGTEYLETLISYSDKPEHEGFVLHSWILAEPLEKALSLASELKNLKLKRISLEERRRSEPDA